MLVKVVHDDFPNVAYFDIQNLERKIRFRKTFQNTRTPWARDLSTMYAQSSS